MRQVYRIFLSLTIFSIMINVSLLALSCAGKMPGNVTSPDAVREAREGKRATVNAAWWGFDEKDATAALQGAIDSGACTVIIPNMGKDWIVTPIRLAGNQNLAFEDGVVVRAKEGEFKGANDCLFRGENLKNLTIRGKATLRMRKSDYMTPAYSKAEWRMGISLWGCSAVSIEGVTVAESGGDGIYITGTTANPVSRNIRVRNVTCDGNYRQGISVISADSLLIENCILSNTSGTSPAAGIDLEPNLPVQRLSNIVVRDCVMSGNEGGGMHHYLGNLSDDSGDVSILYERCRVTGAKGAGIIFGGVRDNGPGGMIEFRDCTVENTADAGAWIFDKSAKGVRVRFVRCTWKNVAANITKADEYKSFMPGTFMGEWGSPAPLWIFVGVVPNLTREPGGIDFVDCVLTDAINRPVVSFASKAPGVPVRDVTGTVRINSPYPPRMEMGKKFDGITLTLRKK
ncbi:MAG: right-handed parallel beta-helix repeat-containing protein [Candidatus Latescibacterota bacterium]